MHMSILVSGMFYIQVSYIFHVCHSMKSLLKLETDAVRFLYGFVVPDYIAFFYFSMLGSKILCSVLSKQCRKRLGRERKS